MAGIWVRAGTVTLTNGSKKVTGSGTAWNTGTNKVTKGCAFIYNNIAYEVDYINSDTELYLVDTYGGTTASGLSYRIQIAVTDTIPELASRIATALAYWNGQAANLQALTTGSGNVTLTAPDGTQVVVPSYSNMQPKDALLTALAALTTAADKLVYFTGADTVTQTTLTSFARTLLDDIDAATARTTLGAQASDATLTALAAVVTAADKLIYATGVDTFSTSTLTSFARTVLAGTDAAAILTTLGASKASIAETITRTATDRVVTPAGLNAVVPYTPTVNPTLDLDFSKQKYRWYAGAAGLTESSTPSLMTFTRSSIATFFDAMGVMKQAAVDTPRIDYDPLTGECNGLLVEEQRTNYVKHSSTFEDSIWSKLGGIGSPSAPTVKPRASLAPDGTLTACTIGFPGQTVADRVEQNTSIAPVATTAYTASVWLKGTGTIALNISTTTGVGGQAETTCSLTQSWQKFTISVTTTSSPTGYMRLMLVLRSGNTATEVSAWGAQLEAGAFPTSYIPTPATFTGRASAATYLDANGVLRTAASGVARSNAYDYDSDGVLRPIGLLLEDAATNLLLYSEQFDNAVWTKSNTTITANAIAAPDGNITADKLVDSAVSGYHSASQSVAASASTTYTKSVYLKAGERSWAKLELYDGSSYLSAYFNLSTGSIGTISSGASASIRKANNGFWRCTITATTSASATTLLGTTHVTTGDAAGVYTGDGTSGIYVWGAQLAAGNYATSYIATTSAQVTRVADTSTSAQTTRATDNAVISGTNFSQWYKQYEGTVTVDVNNQTTTTIDSSSYSRGYAVLSDGTDTNRIRIGNDAGISFAIKKGGADQSSQTVGSVAVGKHKGALSFATNNINAAVDAVSAIQDVSASIPYITQLQIGKSTVTAGLGGAWSSHIRSLKYYPKALSSTELQAMTA